ncbi:oxygen-independent coproporphyrinogen-III oxidase 1 [bacterium BMS3Abin03]|nr:oxygen-independent coproporphyrinogen-III oxidase 1 [bacterium BMS3Abin03]
MKESALYVHIPFCDHKCIYCDFYSIITPDNVAAFLRSVKKEIEFYSERYSTERIITSIFFGGGTPSLMQPEYIAEILTNLNKYFTLSADIEITMETNPGTVNKEKLKSFYDSGINRISIGVQSFDEEELKFLTRIHDKQTAVNTVLYAKETGFDNINIDLIFNLPGQTKTKWLSNLREAVKLPVKHISAYSLILERGTILNKMVLDGKVEMQNDDHDADLYETTIDFLEDHDYHQYEVSNFTKPGFECRHNNAYWHYKDYLSFGTSAHSFINRKRWWNFSSLKRYISEIEKSGNAIAGSEELNRKQIHDEYVMLALRSSGIKLLEYQKKFGGGWINKNYSYLKKLKDDNLILYDDEFIRLTKNGYALCDEILKNLL